MKNISNARNIEKNEPRSSHLRRLAGLWFARLILSLAKALGA